MFGINFEEISLIGLIALLVLGPKQLLQIAKVVGSFIYKIKKQYLQLKEEVLPTLQEDHHLNFTTNFNTSFNNEEKLENYCHFYQPEFDLDQEVSEGDLFENL